MTILPRAMTAGELTNLRRDNQSSRLYLTVHKPATVFSARLAAVPSSTDNVSSITYNSGSGTHTNILADMTVYVGTSAGAYDLGMVRIRNLTGLGAVTGTMNIGMTSEIAWASNAYLTVVDEFALMPRQPYVDGDGTSYMDTDVAYVNQHRYCNSVPIFPRIAVRWLPNGGTVTVIRDGSQSWALNNTINSYAWTAPGNSAISGETTNTVTITYDTANPTEGYRVALEVGNTDLVDFTGYGRVFVLADEDDAITQFNLDRLSGSFSEGGWSAEITCYAQADKATIRDRALVVLHRRDWYGDTEISQGYVADDENIEFIGWIDGETIDWKGEGDPTVGEVSFTVRGAQFWLGKLTMPTVGLKNLNTNPSNWKRFWGLTAKSATWHILMWRTTAPRMMDCFSIENGWAALQLQSGGARNVWEQLSDIMSDFLLGNPGCDAYARLFLQREQQCLNQADRSSIPTVMTITGDEWEEVLPFDYRETNVIAGVDLTGEVYNGTNTTTPVYSLAPGRSLATRGGSVFGRTGLVVSNQTDLNDLAGAIFGWQNNPYPNFRVKFASNFHMVDLFPYQYCEIDITNDDTPRGIVETNLRLIPRKIDRLWNNGFFRTEIVFEAEAPIGLNVTGDTPAEVPDIPVDPPPPPPPPPDPFPTIQANLKGLVMHVMDFHAGYHEHLVYAGDFTTVSQPTWTNLAFPANWLSIQPRADNLFDHIIFVSPSGNRLLLVGIRTVDNKNIIWECTNWASIKTNPSPPAPTWVERVVYTETTIGGDTVEVVGTLTAGVGNFKGEVFYFSCRLNTIWSIAALAADGSLSGTQPTNVNANHGVDSGVYDDVSLVGGNSYQRAFSGAILDTWTDSLFGTQDDGNPYSNEAGTAYASSYVRDAATDQLAIRSGGGYYDVGPWGTCSTVLLRGTFRGPVITAGVELGTNNGFISADSGATWGSFASWGPGALIPVHGVSNNGVVWLRYDVITSGSVPVRLYDSAGSVVMDLTGNWWSSLFLSATNTRIRSARGWYQT